MALQEEINDLIEIFKEEGLTQRESLNFVRPFVISAIQTDPDSEFKLHSLADIQKAIVSQWAEIDAKAYIDAEERALSADGEVVDSLSTDLDLEKIALDWGDGTDGFANLLTAG